MFYTRLINDLEEDMRLHDKSMHLDVNKSIDHYCEFYSEDRGDFIAMIRLFMLIVVSMRLDSLMNLYKDFDS